MSVPQTDTGRRGEYPQALERTVLKELGNFPPYVRKKGSLRVCLIYQVHGEGAEKWLWRLFIKNTVLC